MKHRVVKRSRTQPSSSPASNPSGSAPRAPQGRRYEAEVLPGLGVFARDELVALHGVRVAGDCRDARGVDLATTDRVPFRWTGDGAPPTDALRTVTSLQRVVTFDVPRPKGLLGDEAFRQLVDEVRQVVDANGPFEGLRLEAAGRDSKVFVRLRRALADALGTNDDPDEGELRLRVRPDPDPDAVAGARAWQVLIRTTPRPLSARAWRVQNRPGGLNACVAAAVWRWLGHDRDQRIVNAMCGSGTLAIERAAFGPYARLLGVDLDVDALEAAAANARAAGLDVGGDVGRRSLELELADATSPNDLGQGGFDVFVADPPWGDALGDVAELPEMYDRLLREAARQVVAGGQALIVTHALRVFETALEGALEAWEPNGTVRVFHGGHRPALYRLKRRA